MHIELLIDVTTQAMGLIYLGVIGEWWVRGPYDK
jgi:hypothetical protein